MIKTLKVAILATVLATTVACGTSGNKTLKEGAKSSAALSSAEFNNKINKGKSVLIDVRSPEEFKTNHIKGAQNINVNGASFEKEVSKLNKKKPVLVYCKSGNRSARATNMMRDMGYTVYDLDGGLLKWQAAGLPLEVNAAQQTGYTLAKYLEAVSAGQYVLVDFYAPWCGPCKMMAPHIEALKNKYKGKLTVLKVDTDKSMEVAKNFKISGIPLIKFYKAGKEVYDRTGYHKAEDLEAIVSKYMK